MFTLHWGIHRGTLMSRDIGDNYEFKSESEVRSKLEELKAHFRKIGYCIWFATMYCPDGSKVQLFETPYS